MRPHIVSFSIRIGNVAVETFTTQQFLTEDVALAKARAARDKLNASEYGQRNGTPYRITRSVRRNTAKQL
jgi:uncharacterized protein YjhX (UPF0386 family)